MLKIGVLGAGHLGRIHIKLLKEIDHVELVGFYDPNDENANQANRCRLALNDYQVLMMCWNCQMPLIS